MSAAQLAPEERRLRLVDGGVPDPASPAALRQAFLFRSRPSNAALALTDDDHVPPPPRPRLHLVGDPADAPADPFDVPAEGSPLGAGRDSVWLEEFLARAAAVLRERPRALQQFRTGAGRDELARIRHLRPVRSSAAELEEPGGSDGSNVVELHRYESRRRPERSQC